MTTIDYKAAGVDISAGNEAISRIKEVVESTFNPHVLTPIGAFGAMYDLQWLMQHYHHPVLVQSIDGVGTKMMVAKRMNTFNTIGIDLVSATANDIIVLGARPLTLLDYIANDRLKPEIIEQIILGMAGACRANGIALVGGETAEMPGTYLPGEHDLVGVITGVVEKDKAILGKSIKPGDSILAFSSSGLHTNGYSLARKLFFELQGYDVDHYMPEFSQSLGEELLTPHINYTLPILHLLHAGMEIKGMAHITGGGVLENIPRILPKNCAVEITRQAIPMLPIFSVIQQLSRLDEQQLYRTFNMGIGMVLIVDGAYLTAIKDALRQFPTFASYEIGKVVPGQGEVKLL